MAGRGPCCQSEDSAEGSHEALQDVKNRIDDGNDDANGQQQHNADDAEKNPDRPPERGQLAHPAGPFLPLGRVGRVVVAACLRAGFDRDAVDFDDFHFDFLGLLRDHDAHSMERWGVEANRMEEGGKIPRFWSELAQGTWLAIIL